MGVGQAAVEFWKWFWAGVVVLAIIVGITLGGWQAGWWFSNQNVNRAYQQQQNGLNNQDTNRQLIEKNFATLTNEQVQLTQAQKANDTTMVGEVMIEMEAQAGQLCQEGEIINDAVAYPDDIRSWFSANCQYGAVLPTSKYYIQSATNG